MNSLLTIFQRSYSSCRYCWRCYLRRLCFLRCRRWSRRFHPGLKLFPFLLASVEACRLWQLMNSFVFNGLAGMYSTRVDF
jgi:hypothetical protein